MTSVVEALARAAEHGVAFMLEGDRVCCRNGEALPADLFEALYEQLPELREVLAGIRCRYCAASINWGRFDNAAFGDGSGACLPCYEAAEAERQAPRGTAAGPTGPRAASVANCPCCRKVRPLTGQGVCGQCAAEGRP
jgi:hypothetical protein